MSMPHDGRATASDAADRRREALDRYAVLDTPAEAGFDDLVELACQVCDVPVSLVSLVDRDRQWFKARRGFAPAETGLSQSVCVHALAQDDILTIPDLTADPRTRDNPLVTGECGLRFYAGAVLKTPGGVPFGSLCVIDTVPRPEGLTDRQSGVLRTLARQVVTQLELRRALHERDEALSRGRAAEAVLQRDIDRHDALLALQGAIGAAAGELPAVLDAAVAAALRVIPATEGAAIELREGDELVCAAAAGRLASFAGYRLPVGGSLSGLSLREATTLRTDDAEADARVDPEAARALGIRSVVVAPIARLGHVFGVVKVESSERSAFTAYDMRSAELLASAVAAGFGDVAETRSVRELRGSEAMLRRAQEAAQIGTFSTDIDRRTITASDGFFRLYGLEPAGRLSTDLWETLLVAEDRHRASAHLRREEGADATHAEYRIRRADTGEIRWIARTGDFTRDAAGRPVGLTGIIQDISERRWDQARRDLLHGLDDRFKALAAPSDIAALAVETLGRELDAAACDYVETDAAGARTPLARRWTRPGERIADARPVRPEDLGAEGTAALGAGRVLDVGDPAATPGAAASLGAAALLAVPVIEGGALVGLMVARHGTPRRWSAHEARLLSEAALRTRAAVVGARAELALRRSEARLLLAQDVGGIGTFEVRLDRDEIEASAQMFRLYGLPERQGCPTAYFSDVVLEEDRGLVHTPERRRDPDEPATAEYRIRRASDGALRWMRRVARRIEGRGLAPRLLGVVQDVTDRKLAEMEIAAARDAAEEANRAKSNFLANMSHELRTPLSAVIGYSEMMEEELEEAGERGLLGDLNKIKANAHHLLGLINDVLDLSKVEAGRMDVVVEDVDVAALGAEVAATVEALVGRRNNRFVLRVAEGAGALRSDGMKIRQCLLNLLGNASKFTEGGTITLAAERDGADVLFRVRDTGIGMTEEQLSRLFQRFSQADETTTRRFGGTGLGLALTRAFADLLGGTVAVESALGQGTTFTLRLPAAAPEQPPAERH